MTPSRTYTVRSRYLVKDEGWRCDDVAVTGTFEDAGREASAQAHRLDAEYAGDHFWTVDVYNADGATSGSYYQLFHGRLS